MLVKQLGEIVKVRRKELWAYIGGICKVLECTYLLFVVEKDSAD
jgi:hypothetical protein